MWNDLQVLMLGRTQLRKGVEEIRNCKSVLIMKIKQSLINWSNLEWWASSIDFGHKSRNATGGKSNTENRLSPWTWNQHVAFYLSSDERFLFLVRGMFERGEKIPPPPKKKKKKHCLIYNVRVWKTLVLNRGHKWWSNCATFHHELGKKDSAKTSELSLKVK